MYNRSVNKLKYLSIAVNALKRLKNQTVAAAKGENPTMFVKCAVKRWKTGKYFVLLVQMKIKSTAKDSEATFHLT